MTRSVVHLVPSFGWGGLERLAATIHRLARAAGLRSRIEAPALPALVEGFARETGEAAEPRAAGAETLARWAWAARGRIARERPDVVHAHLPYPDRITATALASAGRPLVVTFGLLPRPSAPWSRDELLRRVRSDHTLAAVARLRPRSRYVAVSASDRDALARIVPARRLALVLNAPPLAPATPAATAPPEWPAGATRLLSVGRLHAQKGLDRMLRALGDPSLRALPWHWRIAGAGEERDALLDAARALGLADRVSVLAGFGAEVLYPGADLVLSPSRFEGMPLVPMEAVEARVAWVGSSIGPHRELFAATPAALLPEDESRWAAHLLPLIADASARRALATAQASSRAVDPRRSMWDAYAELYRTVTSL